MARPTGTPWPWGTVASRFYCWRKVGIWQRLFEAAQQQAEAAGQIDWTLHDVEGTIVRAYQHAAGSPRGAQSEALGQSQEGFSTQVHLRAADEKHCVFLAPSPAFAD
jgi:hypothetical protein